MTEAPRQRKQSSAKPLSQGLTSVDSRAWGLNEFWGCDLGLSRTALLAVQEKLLREKRFDDLIAILRSVRDDRPEDYLAEMMLAAAFEQAGRREDAMSAYESALAKAKAALDPFRLRTVAAQIQNRLEQARPKKDASL